MPMSDTASYNQSQPSACLYHENKGKKTLTVNVVAIDWIIDARGAPTDRGGLNSTLSESSNKGHRTVEGLR